MNVSFSKLRRMGLPALILSLTMAALVAPARAGSVIRFDPTGGGGVNPGVTILTSQFSYAPGNALGIGAITPGTGFVQGTTFELKYQAILGSIAGVTVNGGGVAVVGQQTDLAPSNGGEIITGGIGGAATGREVTITADFRERIVSSTVSGGQINLTFALDPTGPNVVSLYSAPAGTAKNFLGTGFDAGVLIARGSVIQNGIEGTYSSNFSTPTTGSGSPTSPVAFDQYGADAAALAFYSAITTTSGTGSTFLPVAINPAFTNAAYFPAGAPAFFQLTFPSVSAADPFSSVEPSRAFFGGTAPNIGAINGVSGPNIQFQVQAANDFVSVPEPTSIIPALTAFAAIPLVLGFRRRRSSKQGA
jgi:hypothetical protein